MAHSLEAWFGAGDAPLSDRFVLSIIEEAMEAGPELMNNLENYDLRARIMWAATVALNDTTMYGRVSGDWGVHGLGHILSYLYDTAHGATLSIFYPAWIRHIGKTSPARIIELGTRLFATSGVEETANALESFFSKLGSPIRAGEAGIAEDKREHILELMAANKVSGIHHRLKKEDHEAIVDLIFE